MLLATRCPHCETVFRLRQEQLSLHGGLARCGHCQQIFNAAESLVDEHAHAEPALVESVESAQPAESAEAAAPRAADNPRLFVNAPADDPAHKNFMPDGWDMWAPWLDGGIDPSLQHNGRNVGIEPLVPVTLPEPGAMPAIEAGIARLMRRAPAAAAAQTESAAPMQPASPAHETHEPALRSAVAPAHDAREPQLPADDWHEPSTTTADDPHAPFPAAREPRFAGAAPSEPEPEPFAAALADDDRPHFAVTRESRAPRRRGLLGGFLGGLVAAALAALLIVQLAWWQRETLMIYWPVTQGWFQRLCAPLGCTVAPPRAIDGLRLNATDLRQLDGPRVLELKAPLTNRYRVALAYPSIELTLLDDANRIAARRVLAPRDYVRPGTPIAAGLPAGATQTMIVRIETNGAPASNFRVQIFYP